MIMNIKDIRQPMTTRVQFEIRLAEMRWCLALLVLIAMCGAEQQPPVNTNLTLNITHGPYYQLINVPDKYLCPNGQIADTDRKCREVFWNN